MIANAKTRMSLTATPPTAPRPESLAVQRAVVSNLPSSAPTSTFADPEANQGPLELGSGALLVRRRGRTRGEDLLSAIAGLLRAARVDLLGRLGGVGQNDHAVAADIHESAEHRQDFLDAAALHLELAGTERGEEGSVVRQDPYIAIGRRRDDHVDVVLVHLPLGRDDFEMERHQLDAPSFARRSPFSRACSTVPTL